MSAEDLYGNCCSSLSTLPPIAPGFQDVNPAHVTKNRLADQCTTALRNQCISWTFLPPAFSRKCKELRDAIKPSPFPPPPSLGSVPETSNPRWLRPRREDGAAGHEDWQAHCAEVLEDLVCLAWLGILRPGGGSVALGGGGRGHMRACGITC